MIATSYVILLVLHILDFQLDAEKIIFNSLARQLLYLTLIVFGQRTTYWDITQVILVAWINLSFKSQHQNSNSHLLFLYVSYRNSGEKMLKYQ